VTSLQLDCNACKTSGSMHASKVGKFSKVVRVIGGILLIPSVLGMLIAVLIFFFWVLGSVGAARGPSGAEGAVVFVFCLFIGIASLVGGLLGWLLLMNRKVYKCVRCGFILDRA